VCVVRMRTVCVCVRMCQSFVFISALGLLSFIVCVCQGKGCVAIAADKRLGIQLQTVSTDFKKVFKMNDKLYCGLVGLAVRGGEWLALCECMLSWRASVCA